MKSLFIYLLGEIYKVVLNPIFYFNIRVRAVKAIDFEKKLRL